MLFNFFSTDPTRRTVRWVVHSGAAFKEKSSCWANLKRKSRLLDECAIQIRAVYHWDMSITLRSLNNIHIHNDSFSQLLIVNFNERFWFAFHLNSLSVRQHLHKSGIQWKMCLPAERRQGVNKSRQCLASILQTQVARLVVGETQ